MEHNILQYLHSATLNSATVINATATTKGAPANSEALK